jgi:tetratricopeptide (TPR) repeat protein
MPVNRKDMLRGFIAQKPDDPFPRYALALEFKNAGELAEAAEVFGELIARIPDYTATYLHAGNTLRALGKLEDARATYEAGVTACQRKGDSHALGEVQGALMDLQMQMRA